MTRRILSAIGLVATFAMPAAGEDENTTLARAAIQGYTQHLDTFSQFTCRWEFYGRSPVPRSMADCAKDGPMTPKRVASYVQDGDFWVYNDEGEPAVDGGKKGLPKDSKPAVAWTTRDRINRYAGDATRVLSYDAAGQGQASLHEEDVYERRREHLRGVLLSPLHRFGFRGMSPERNVAFEVAEAERAGRKWAAGARGTVNGVECLAVSVEGPRPSEQEVPRTVFHLAIPRGFLPFRIEEFVSQSGKEVMVRQHDILEVKECGTGRYFPMLTRHIIRQPHADGGEQYVCGYSRTLSVEVGKPGRDDMCIHVPGDVVIYRMDVKGAPAVVTKQNEKVRADELGYLTELSEKRRETPYIDTALTPPPPKWPWYVGGGVVALLLAATGVWAWRRARRRRAPA